MAKFGTSGIRGLFNELDPQTAFKVGNIFAKILGKRLGVATDNRKTSEAIKHALLSGILSSGSNAVDLGILPSPVAEFYNYNKLDGLFIVTASHNPPEYNGIKVVDKNGLIIRKEVANRIMKNEVSLVDWKNAGYVRQRNALPFYVKRVLKRFKEIKKEVVVDYGNGTGSIAFPVIAKKLGLNLLEINSHVNGMFPGRNSEPTEQNLTLLKQFSKEEGKIGIAFDGDCDRLSMIDERGNFVSGDKTFALAVKAMYEEGKKGDVVTTVATTKAIEEIAKEHGFKVRYAVVGAPYIADETSKKDVMTGGEEVGTAIFKEFSLAKDGFLTALTILKHLGDKKLSERLNELPQWFKVKKIIRVKDDEEKKRIVEKFKSHFKDEKRTEIDGLRVDFDDWWFIIRPSGTEPLVRLFVEAKTKSKALKKLNELEKLIYE